MVQVVELLTPAWETCLLGVNQQMGTSFLSCFLFLSAIIGGGYVKLEGWVHGKPKAFLLEMPQLRQGSQR